MFGHLRDVVEHQLVGVAHDVVLSVVGVGVDLADNLDLGVLELRVSAELSSLLLVLELVAHIYVC